MLETSRCSKHLAFAKFSEVPVRYVVGRSSLVLLA